MKDRLKQYIALAKKLDDCLAKAKTETDRVVRQRLKSFAYAIERQMSYVESQMSEKELNDYITEHH